VIGVGGTCADRVPPAGYWCASTTPRDISPPQHPTGLIATQAQLPHLPYSNPTGAVVHAFRPGHWYTSAFEVGVSQEALKGSTRLNFSRGGTQGAEGLPYADSWYVENVLEELDAPREWYFDPQSRTLYYAPNASDHGAEKAPPSEGFVATRLQVLINVSGSKAAPVRGLTIRGLILRDTARTAFEPHAMPSGGDWAIAQRAAIMLRGTEDVFIANSLFTHLDGNAIFAVGYHSRLTVHDNEFHLLGESAILIWGETSECLNQNCSMSLPPGIRMGPDGRTGTQPFDTRVEGNLAHELGIWQKQSAFFFQAVAARTTLKGNVVFNTPRAAFSFNDGFGGGDEIFANLLLNTCRESSDHGPFNLWDRVPYITTVRSGMPSTVPATRRFHHNFVLANYFSQEAVDTDDGSSHLTVEANVLAYGDNGLKAVFGGHNIEHVANTYLFVGTCFDFVSFKGYATAFQNNACLCLEGYASDRSVGTGGNFQPAREARSSDCGLDPLFGHRIGSNRIFYHKSESLMVCGVPFLEWQTRANDARTSLEPWPGLREMRELVIATLGSDLFNSPTASK
jgi:hypothetical protein